MSHAGHDDSSSGGGGGNHATMVPYFHSTPGDHLFFKFWVPKTPGAIAGACIGLFLLGMLDRWLSATRNSFELQWKHRAMILSSQYSTNTQDLSRSSTPDEKAQATITGEGGSKTRVPPPVPRLRRTIAPFVASHDIPRGILHAFQSAIGFLLMLATMSYRIEWIVSIIIGLGLGETLFGRFGSGSVH